MTASGDAQARKQVALQFLRLVEAGRIDEAYRKHVDMRGRHHNTFVLAGFPELQKAMMDAHLQFPSMRLTVKNVLGEGDIVAVHSHVVLRPGEAGMVVMHIFRFSDDKIVELWDFSQPLQAELPNKDGPF